MARKKKKAAQTSLSAKDKASLRRILSKVRKFPRKKASANGAAATGGKTSACIFSAADIKRQTTLVNSLVARGIGTAAQLKFFNAQNALLTKKLSDFAAAGCDQSLLT